MKMVFEGKLKPEFQDGKQAMICELSGDEPMFVRLQSWDEAKAHETLTLFAGADKVRVTIETI